MHTDRVILHVDMNNFYASVECLYRPELKDIPIAVCGDIEQRHGIVLAKNQLAKKFGISTGETIGNARLKCPNITFVPANFDRYIKYSKLAREIYDEYSDNIEPFGIDECWLDVSGSVKLFGSGVEIADTIRNRISTELGLTVSIGVSYNKVLAKMGSDLRKPNFTTEITPYNFRTLLWNLPVGDLFYVGPATQRKLCGYYNIKTIGELACCDPEFLTSRLGKHGAIIYNFANGIDNSPVMHSTQQHEVKSIGNSTTTVRDLTCDTDVAITLYSLCANVSAKLRASNLKCTTISLSIRDKFLYSYTRQTKVSATNIDKDIFSSAMNLYRINHRSDVPIRSIGIHASGLCPEESYQLSLFDDAKEVIRKENIVKTIDKLKAKYGSTQLKPAFVMQDASIAHFDDLSDDVVTMGRYSIG